MITQTWSEDRQDIKLNNMPGVVLPSRSYNIAIVGSGLGGLSAAIALRRQGHNVTIYERRDFAGEVGASLSVAVSRPNHGIS